MADFRLKNTYIVIPGLPLWGLPLGEVALSCHSRVGGGYPLGHLEINLTKRNIAARSMNLQFFPSYFSPKDSFGGGARSMTPLEGGM